ncbi:MAG: hypothetical protein JWO00_591 [Candidatus Parcubacteria bacterium]|nr:hypothetical protein [Candidatus Parcubacteria bacterium]
MKRFNINYAHLVAALLGGLYFFSCAVNPTFGHLIDYVDLVIHEAGHVFMAPFGMFIYILGGSAFQVVVPSLFVGYFYFRREYFSASMILLWVGYNIVNISAYMGDAVSTQMLLLGGEGVIHDWNYLLSALGVLDYTHDLASITHGFGMAVMIAAAAFCLKFSFSNEAHKV